MRRSIKRIVTLGSLPIVLLVVLSLLPNQGRAAPVDNGEIYLPVLFDPRAPAGPETTLVSQHTNGTQGDESSLSPRISADGRFVTFTSDATNLVDDDTNGFRDVFIFDRQSGETTLISRHSNGTQGNEMSFDSSISADGRYVVFNSRASNLIDNDTNGFSDVFLHDRQSGQTELVSLSSNGNQGNSWTGYGTISADGRFVTALARATNLVDDDDNGQPDIFVFDLQTDETTLVSRHTDGTLSNGESWWPSISPDGQYIAFASQASNLVDADTNGFYDVFVHDRQTGETTLVSVRTDGTQGNAASSTVSYVTTISEGGEFVVFSSDASNLVDGDTNGSSDVFVHNRNTGETDIVSRHSSGTLGDDTSESASLSADGRYIAFYSEAANLIDDDSNNASDVFVHDQDSGETVLVSISSDGTQGDLNSYTSALSQHGRYVVFYSEATNLVEDDTNNFRDVFVHDRGG